MGKGSSRPRRAGRIVALAALACLSAATSTGDPQQELITLTQRFLEAVAAGDTGYLAANLYPEARFVYIEKKPDGTVISSSSTALLLEAAPQWKSRVEERIHDPRVLVDGRIGLVWGRYEYHMDGRLSHCGTDLFTFMKTDDGWRLASGSWTVEHEACEGRAGPQP